MLKEGVLVLAGLLAAIAAWTDWRWRRIPNWLTVPGAAAGIVANSLADGWDGAKSSLEGLGLGLLLLLPFLVIRALGAGDWKLVGAVGAILGWRHLLVVLVGTLLIAGVMAIILVIYKRRSGEMVRNIGRLLVALATGHPGVPSISLDNPESLKIPFGIAMAIAVILFVASHVVLRVSR